LISLLSFAVGYTTAKQQEEKPILIEEVGSVIRYEKTI